jgi:hypothetical protein
MNTSQKSTVTPRLIPVQTWVDRETYDALAVAAKAAGVTVQALASETLTVSMGGNRTCAIS